MKQRLDVLLVERDLVQSREQARQLIRAGLVLVAGQVLDKPGVQVSVEANISLKETRPYASRGGLKLAAALDAFRLDPVGLVVIDVGASTGGFTDVLLQRGAHKVYAIDVGYGQLAWHLRQDPRVVVMERTNIRYLTGLPELVDLAVVDVSFISLELVLPVVKNLLKGEGQIVVLIKPQFEAGRELVGKGGVIRDPEVHRAVLCRVLSWARERGLYTHGLIRSPIVGPAGNVEFLAHLVLVEREGGVELEALVESVLRNPEFPQVICLGDINTDIIAPIPRYPEPGGDGHADDLAIVPGGSAANTAIALSKLGVRTGLIGRIGTDVFGTELLSRLAGFGLDVSRVQRDPQVATGLMFIPVTPGGERTMFGCRGANARLSLSQPDRAIITQARLLHLSGYSLLDSPQREATMEAMAWAHAAGLQVSLDAGLEAIKQQSALLAQWLEGLSILLPNEAEATALTGQPDPEQAVRWLLGRGVQAVALKRGRAGCLIGRGDEMMSVSAFEVQSVDSTGAGDAFNAGFMTGWLRGLELRLAALLGNALGALTTLHYGAMPPEVSDLRAFLSNQRIDPAWAGWAGELAQLEEFLSTI